MLARDGLRDVDAVELLDGVVEHANAESGLPGLREGAHDGGHVGADGMAFGPGSATRAGQARSPLWSVWCEGAARPSGQRQMASGCPTATVAQGRLWNCGGAALDDASG